MATEKQKAANRRNAQKSTGPRTLEGKLASSANALKTGIDAKSTIIRGESEDQLQALTAEYYNRWIPTTPEERFLVDTLISSEWLRRRCLAIETSLMDEEFDHPNMTLSIAYRNRADHLNRLQRRLDSAQRNYFRALRELHYLQSMREPTEDELQPEPHPEQAKPHNPQLGSFRNLSHEPSGSVCTPGNS